MSEVALRARVGRAPLRANSAGLRLGLYPAELTTPRNGARIRRLKEAFGADAVICLAKSHSRQPVESLPPSNTGAASCQRSTRPLDADLTLVADALTTCSPQTSARYGTWTIADGDPRHGCGPSALPRAIAAGRSRVGMTIARLQAGAPQVLAFCDVPRRPWDSLECLQRRLDAYLPILLREALERARAMDDACASAGALDLAPAEGGSSYNIAQRLRDGRYFLHLAARAVRLSDGKQKTRIIGLHDPAPDVLDALLTSLGRTNQFLRYSESVARLREGRPLEPGVIVTFDDGYKRNMALLDVLERHRCPAMFFINTRFVDTRDAFWFMDHEGKRPGEKERLKRLSYRSYLSASVASPSLWRDRCALTSAEIRVLKEKGHEVGVHTHNHPFLSNPDVDVRAEFVECHLRLCAILRDDDLPLHVAYPDGDFSQSVIDTVRELHAISAVTTRPAPVDRSADVLKLPRFIVGDADYTGTALLKLTRAYSRWQAAPRNDRS